MRVLLQVVEEASVKVYDKEVSSINKGFLLFVGFTNTDDENIMHKTIDKALDLRLFQDQNGKTNLSLKDVGGQVMCISQFTLYADVKKGRRPSFIKAMKQEEANELYQKTLEYIKSKEVPLSSGIFQADMKVKLINDGPFTIFVDSEEL